MRRRLSILFLFLVYTTSHAFAPYTQLHGVARSTSRWNMGLQVNIRMMGKATGGEPWIAEGCTMYETRLQNTIGIQTEWHKTSAQLVKSVETDRSKGVVVALLDPVGKPCTSSEAFADQLYDWFEQGGSRVTFVIGEAAEGIPSELKYPASGVKPRLVSLSSLTFTHQFARLVLIEQIYRASEIRKGSGYHK